MPASTGNLQGSADPTDAPHGAWDSFKWEPFPAYNGNKSVYFRSKDGKVVFGALREAGKSSLVWPVDECLFVTNGWMKVQFEGGESFTLNKGDITMIRKGQNVHFEMSEDYANVAVFMSDEPITLV